MLWVANMTEKQCREGEALPLQQRQPLPAEPGLSHRSILLLRQGSLAVHCALSWGQKKQRDTTQVLGWYHSYHHKQAVSYGSPLPWGTSVTTGLAEPPALLNISNTSHVPWPELSLSSGQEQGTSEQCAEHAGDCAELTTGALSPLAMCADKLLTSPWYSNKAALRESQALAALPQNTNLVMSPTAVVGRGNLKAESCPSALNVFMFQRILPLLLHKTPQDFRQPHAYMIIGIVSSPHFCFLSLLVTVPSLSS